MKKNQMKYKGYTGSVEWSESDGVFYGKVLGIWPLLLYEGKNIEELREDFHVFVDEYIQDCLDRGIEPEAPFKGSVNVRISRQLHKKAFNMAYDRDVSLNTIVNEALKAYLL